MDKAIDLLMIAFFLVGVVNLFTGIAGVFGTVALGFSVMYALVVYGIAAFRKFTGR